MYDSPDDTGSLGDLGRSEVGMLASLPRVPPWSYTKEVAQTEEDQGRNDPGNPEGIGKNRRGARTAYDYVERRKRQRIYSDAGKAELRSYELRVEACRSTTGEGWSVKSDP